MKKILIVEDDRELKEGICYALQKAGYLTESADSVQNAKTLFLKEGADVILLDVNLPDGEGFDFCKWVKERTPVPVLFLTARDLEEDALCGYEAGAEDYVTKPFSMKILLKKIDVLCRNGSRQLRLYEIRCRAHELQRLHPARPQNPGLHAGDTAKPGKRLRHMRF